MRTTHRRADPPFITSEHDPRQLHRDRPRATPPRELVVPREVLRDEPLETRAMRANLLLEDRVHLALLLRRREVRARDPARQIDGLRPELRRPSHAVLPLPGQLELLKVLLERDELSLE